MNNNSNPPLLRYFGGKYRDRSKIISNFPPHEFFVEPYGGGGSVLLDKYPSAFEVYNDLNGELVNFFKVLRDRSDELIRAIELTPYSRLEWKLAFEDADDPLESARRLYVRSWQSRGSDGVAGKNPGWRFIWQSPSGQDVVSCFNRTTHLWDYVARLKNVQIECDDAIAVIHRYGRNPKALIYCDPPYLHETRTSADNYKFEMNTEEHRQLAELLRSIPAMSLVSGYEHEIYHELYQGWRCVKWESQINGNSRKATESLWISPNCETELPLLNLIQGMQKNGCATR